MQRTKIPCAAVMAILGSFLAQPAAPAGDWPQWRGPDREAVSTETGLLHEWPEDGPPLLWALDGFGKGYSSVSIAGKTLYTMGDVDAEGKKSQCILAVDLDARKHLWATRIGSPHSDGPRSTPTVNDGLVYAVGTDGVIACVDAATGKPIWHKDFKKDFGVSKSPGWRYSESPYVDGDVVICTPGSPDALLAALEKKTGKVVWKCSVPEAIRADGKGMHAEYSTIAAAEVGGIRQYITLIARAGLVGVAAKDGRFLWRYKRIINGTANVPTAVVRGDLVFCSTAYGTGSALLKLVPSGKSVKAEEVYFLDADTFQNHHGGVVRVGDYIYGGHGHNAGAPTCLEMKTGKILWKAKQPGKGSAAVLYADGCLYFRYQDDTVALIEATPKAYHLKGKFKIAKRRGMSGNAWAHPVILDGKLYIRHADWLLCYDVKAK